MPERLTVRRDFYSRVGGIVEIVAGDLFPGTIAVNILNSDLPIPLKILASAPFVVGMVYFTVEGAIDVALGTHHYFGLQLWRRLSKSESRRNSIDADINYMLTHKSERIKFP